MKKKKTSSGVVFFLLGGRGKKGGGSGMGLRQGNCRETDKRQGSGKKP